MFWVALPSPRNSALERLAGSPWLRKVVQRLPARLREQKLGRMAFVLALNTEGQVVHNLQDPAGSYGPVTSVTETNGRLYFGSIGTAAIGWVLAPKALRLDGNGSARRDARGGEFRQPPIACADLRH